MSRGSGSPAPARLGLSRFGDRPRGKTRVAAAVVWLAFIVFPLVDAVGQRGPALGHVLAIAGAAVFVVVYVWLVLISVGRDLRRLASVLVAILIIDASALTLADRTGWAYLFTYCAASAVLVGPASTAFAAVLGCAGLAVAGSILGGSASTALSSGATTLGVGLLMVLMLDLQARNQELSEARAELARVAVAQERERFARDLHDLLGHTLSVIALKAELAGKLIPGSPARALGEVGEVEAVARHALGEVRLAVSGYRQPTLDGELAGARLALSAAGIEADVVKPETALDPDVEAVLAWAVREGATNVIRHSGARRCTVRVAAGGADASVEVIDDGSGDAGAAGAEALPGPAVNGHRGNGLAGLGERAEALNGRVEAGAGSEGGGFRLAVRVPVVATTRR